MKIEWSELPTLDTISFDVKDVNYKEITGGEKFKMMIDFGEQKYDKV